ncbi:MAG TPA: hypothetical protein VG125_05765 [Pirellulales bacterium]|nr:hypothetical protein [Pirellulales bacterium]
MRRSTFLPAVLTLVLFAGCGQSNPPAKSPAPAYQPTNQPTGEKATGEQAPANQPAVDATSPELRDTEEPAPARDDGAEEMPAEEREAIGDEAAENSAPAATADTAGEKSTGAASSAEDAEPTTQPRAAKGGGASGKLLRGLGSSFGRGLSKAITAVGSEGPKRPPPDLADDPFPNGEPTEDKPKE